MAISQVQLLDEVVVPVVCSDICPLLTVPRCRVVVKVSLLMVLTIMHGTA